MTTEPYIRVWAADMRADPKIQGLVRRGAAYPYWLIQAWDIAKTGPGDVDELRGPDGAAMTEVEFAGLIPGATTARVRLWRLALLELGLADLTEDHALRFPALKRRQSTELREARRAAGLRGAQKRWQTDGNGDSNGHGKTMPPDPDAISRETEGQSPVGTTAHGRLTDQKNQDRATPEVVALDLPGDVVYEIERLAVECTDRDAGTVGRLVELARRGAGVSDFADARAALAAVHKVGSRSRYACKVIENRLAAT